MQKLLRFFPLIALSVIFYAPAAGQLVWTAEGHTDNVLSVAFSPDGKYLASGSSDNTVRLWDVTTGEEVRRFDGHTNSVKSVAFSPDGKYLASGSRDNTVRLWDVTSGEEVHRIDGHTNDVNSVAFSPDGKYLASASHIHFFAVGFPLRLWDAITGEEVRRFDGHTSNVNLVAFSPDGKYLVSASGGSSTTDDTTVRLWDVTNGAEVRRYDGHRRNSVAFSPDGEYLASDVSYWAHSGDNYIWTYAILVWDATTGEEVLRYDGKHTTSIVSVTFSPDGKYLASGSGDSTVRLWDVTTGREVHRFDIQFDTVWNWVHSVEFSPDGAYLASGSADDKVRLWEVALTNTASELLPDHKLPKFTHFPNPAESFVTVEYDISEMSAVALYVRDLLGREVMNVVNGTQPAGSHRLQLNTDRLPRGAYFLHLLTDGNHTAQVLLVR